MMMKLMCGEMSLLAMSLKAAGGDETWVVMEHGVLPNGFVVQPHTVVCCNGEAAAELFWRMAQRIASAPRN
jgi:hypothetical protein